ncbi:MAG: SprT-like domain-containing protein [Chitinophagaceae bacterium]|nr:SprT-like domain-containing protein [Chitinophagaceae bacterium]
MTPAENLATQLLKFLPEDATDIVARWIIDYKIALTITRKRRSILGDYRWPGAGKGHRISVNGDLNQYAFLVTLVHEVAHLVTWEKHKHAVSSHGQEWKNEFRLLMDQFTGRRIFPEDVRTALKKYFVNPSATHCADPVLIKVLNKYNKHPVFHLEDLEHNGLFLAIGGRVFKKGEKLRKRYRCVEVQTKRVYLFSPVAEVMKVNG